VDVDSRQENAADCEAGEVLKAREQASFLIYTPWATCLRMPKASRLVIRRLCSRNAIVFRFLGMVGSSATLTLGTLPGEAQRSTYGLPVIRARSRGTDCTPYYQAGL
jgi:hypothetical protein